MAWKPIPFSARHFDLAAHIGSRGRNKRLRGLVSCSWSLCRASARERSQLPRHSSLGGRGQPREHGLGESETGTQIWVCCLESENSMTRYPVRIQNFQYRFVAELSSAQRTGLLLVQHRSGNTVISHPSWAPDSGAITTQRDSLSVVTLLLPEHQEASQSNGSILAGVYWRFQTAL